MNLDKAQLQFLKQQTQSTSLTLGARNLIGLLVNEKGILPTSRLEFDTPRRREEKRGKAHATHGEYLIEVLHAASAVHEINDPALKSLVSELLNEKTKEAKRHVQPAYYIIKATLEEQFSRVEVTQFINEQNDDWHYAVILNSNLFRKPPIDIKDHHISNPANLTPARKTLLHAMMGIPGETFEQNAHEIDLAEDALEQVYRSFHIDSDKAHEFTMHDREAIALSLYAIKKYAFTITEPEWHKTVEPAEARKR